ncbi:hypothetical protein LTR08_004286 [Meristemomyces frigidus]|nr:hypothetical protein LTR08_004286 [Meristemomyces frigidus]
MSDDRRDSMFNDDDAPPAYAAAIAMPPAYDEESGAQAPRYGVAVNVNVGIELVDMSRPARQIVPTAEDHLPAAAVPAARRDASFEEAVAAALPSFALLEAGEIAAPQFAASRRFGCFQRHIATALAVTMIALLIGIAVVVVALNAACKRE